jgi:archaellum component FlaC
METSIQGLMNRIDELGEKLGQKNTEINDLQEIIKEQTEKLERLELLLRELQSL